MTAPAVRAAVASAAAGVAAARARIAAGHAAGAAGRASAALATDLLDAVVRGVWDALLDERPEAGAAVLRRRVAVVAHGGFGRREMAPHSDVDVMLLHDAGGAEAAAEASRIFVQDLFDAGLQVGQSVRGVAEACRLAAGDATILSTLLDCRTLAGPSELADQLTARLRRLVRRAPRRHAARLVAARRDEAVRFGQSVALLEPNVKRSPGGLRDVQLVGWLGRVLHDAGTLDELAERGGLAPADAAAVAAAAEFLTRVRIDLHIAAGRCADDLTRDQQVRLAGALGLETEAGVLGVERFMREYLGHTRRVARAVETLARDVHGTDPARRVAARLLGHRVDALFLVGPRAVAALPGRVERVAGDLAAIVRLVELALLHDVPIAADTWEVVRRRAAALPREPDAAACSRFRGLFSPPAALAGGGRGLADALRRLHDAGILERFVPEFAGARDLPQFNSFHAYTVDEHSLLAVEQGCRLATAAGWPATEWRELPRPHLLLLALLLHDLGKGGIEDHSVVGAGIAARVGARLGLPADEAALVEFLVRHHLAMAKLAFRRDGGDESLVAEFARLVGGPEALRLLTLLTAADVAAVAPGTWTRWKADLLGDLHYRTLRCLDGEPPAAGVARARAAVAALLEQRAPDDPLRLLARDLPASYLGETPPERIVEELGRLARLPADGVFVTARWEPHTSTVAVTVITHERVAAGVFHRAVGGLAALHLDVLAADIHTLADGHVVDHFTVVDPDSVGAPPAERLAEIAAAVRSALLASAPPEFRRRWNPFAPQPAGAARSAPQVRIDTTSSRHSTIVEVFAHDAPGLLHAVARAIFAAGLSVRAAKIGTYRDQVVDAFHVTDAAGRKVTDPAALDVARRAIEQAAAPLTRPA